MRHLRVGYSCALRVGGGGRVVFVVGAVLQRQDAVARVRAPVPCGRAQQRVLETNLSSCSTCDPINANVAPGHLPLPPRFSSSSFLLAALSSSLLRTTPVSSGVSCTFDPANKSQNSAAPPERLRSSPHGEGGTLATRHTTGQPRHLGGAVTLLDMSHFGSCAQPLTGQRVRRSSGNSFDFFALQAHVPLSRAAHHPPRGCRGCAPRRKTLPTCPSSVQVCRSRHGRRAP